MTASLALTVGLAVLIGISLGLLGGGGGFLATCPASASTGGWPSR
jgi:uncharacterized membrane protein YfcA